jgi:hypothetical protein
MVCAWVWSNEITKTLDTFCEQVGKDGRIRKERRHLDNYCTYNNLLFFIVSLWKLKSCMRCRCRQFLKSSAFRFIYVAFVGICLPTFRDNLSSKVKQFKEVERIGYPEMPVNNTNRRSIKPRTKKTSTTPRQKSEIWLPQVFLQVRLETQDTGLKDFDLYSTVILYLFLIRF